MFSEKDPPGMSHPQSRPTDQELHRLFDEACLAQTGGDFVEAKKKYLLLLDYFPQAAELHYNLGLVYYRLKNFSAALDEFSTALRSQPEDGDTLFNLALCQKKSGANEAAITTYQKLMEITPESTDCCYNLAGCYKDSFDDAKAISCYLKVLALDPDFLPALNNLAYMYHRGGENQQAELCYKKLLALRPEDESAQYMLDSLLGAPLSQTPDAYVRSFFDGYAEEFENSLVDGLGYDNPQQLFESFAHYCQAKEIPKNFERGLDLGCGTGLCGVVFKEMVATLHGMDLSANMLLQAADKNCYAALYQDSIVHYLATTPETYDFFLATDVFIYVGALETIFAGLRAIARPRALFCFSTEALESGDYQLQKTGRFAYSRSYIERTAAATGWITLSTEGTGIRKEKEHWLAGDLWILQLA
jgi:predicted TPR repeat methyltransferase